MGVFHPYGKVTLASSIYTGGFVGGLSVIDEDELSIIVVPDTPHKPPQKIKKAKKPETEQPKTENKYVNLQQQEETNNQYELGLSSQILPLSSLSLSFTATSSQSSPGATSTDSSDSGVGNNENNNKRLENVLKGYRFK